ncbi:MAG: hypothetical protein QXK37_05800 [Candidatus Woesearchaeota archaeon]
MSIIYRLALFLVVVMSIFACAKETATTRIQTQPMTKPEKVGAPSSGSPRANEEVSKVDETGEVVAVDKQIAEIEKETEELNPDQIDKATDEISELENW